MKHLRKSILTLLALTLFGGAGAWAQGPTAAELTIPANWNLDLTPITAADLPGFVAVDSATADQWVDASTTGYAKLIYAFTTDGQAKYIRFQPGFKGWGTNTYYRIAAYEDYDHDFQVFYTTGDGTIELTKEGANQWSLGQTPDYDLELQVEYYEAHALKDIPAGWTVKVNGIEQQTPYQGDSLMITETDSVTLVPAGNPRRVKSVTLEEEVPPTTVLGGALVDGAIIKVNFNWRGMNSGDYVQGVYNAASGTFTVSKGGNNWGRSNNNDRAVYKVEKSGDNIIIGAGFYDYNQEGMVWTFNTTNDTYTTTYGSWVDSPGEFGLISVTLNGTDITSQLTAQ